MEPITTTAMIGTIVGYLAKTIKDNKSVQDFFKDFTTASVGWLRPLFLKGGGENDYEKIIADLLKNPESSIKQDQIKTAIASHLEDNPKDEAFLKEMYEVLNEKAGRGEGISIVNSKNVNTGNVNTGGGDFILGDGHARK
jgi:hypothetical protein